MDLTAIFAPMTAWFDAHPAAIAWFTGWLAALSAGQTFKQMLPPTWNVTAVKRAVQIVAMVTGGVFAFVLWPMDPAHPTHAIPESIVCGMSAPTIYTLLKAVIEARWPRLAYGLSWRRVQDRNGVPPPPECQPNA